MKYQVLPGDIDIGNIPVRCVFLPLYIVTVWGKENSSEMFSRCIVKVNQNNLLESMNRSMIPLMFYTEICLSVMESFF